MPVAFEQPQKLRNLARDKGSRPLDVREWAALPGDIAEPCQAGGVGQADSMPHAGIADIRLGHLVAGVEAVDLLHQVEHHPEHVEVIAAGDEAGMRNR